MSSIVIERNPIGGFIPDDQEVVDEMLYWVVDTIDPTKKRNAFSFTPRQLGFLAKSAQAMLDHGLQILDKEGDFPTLQDANALLGAIKAQWPEIPGVYAGYVDLGQLGMFNVINFERALQYDARLRPTNPTFPYLRKFTTELEPPLRDWPSPWDFTTILYAAAYRVSLRMKYELQRDKIRSFGRHGGRPRKLL